jgi:hypothetical protein
MKSGKVTWKQELDEVIEVAESCWAWHVAKIRHTCSVKLVEHYEVLAKAGLLLPFLHCLVFTAKFAEEFMAAKQVERWARACYPSIALEAWNAADAQFSCLQPSDFQEGMTAFLLEWSTSIFNDTFLAMCIDVAEINVRQELKAFLLSFLEKSVKLPVCVEMASNDGFL